MNLTLIINALLYFLLAVALVRRYGITLSSALSIFYLFIAVMGIVVVNNGLYENVFTIRDRNAVILEPYLLCFVSIVVLLLPLNRVRYNNMNLTATPFESPLIKYGLYLWYLDMICFIGLKVTQGVIAMSMGLDEMYDITNVDGDSVAVLYGGNLALLKFNNININLQYSLSPFLITYAFYGLIKGRVSRGRAYTIIALVFAAQVANAVAFGSRGNMFLSFCAFGFYLILFYGKLPGTDRNLFKGITIGLLVVLGFYSALTSVARVKDSHEETPLGSVVRYFGEPFPNLSNHFYEHVSYHPEGTRLFPYIKGGPQLINSTIQGDYDYWEGVTGVQVRTFKTIFGDLYIEYGTEKAMVIIFLVALAFYLFVGKRKIRFWKMAFLYWYYDLILQGIFGFNKSGYSQMIVFTAVLMVSLCVKIAYQDRAEPDIDSTDTNGGPDNSPKSLNP